MRLVKKSTIVNSTTILPIAIFLSLVLSACAISTTPVTTQNLNSLSKETIAEIIASPDRSASDKTNDVRRKPDLILAFIGIRAGMVALDLSAGGGYTTELLARAVGPTGRVYGQSPPKNPDSQQKAGVTPEGNATPVSAATKVDANAAARPIRLSSPEALAERAKNPIVKNIIPIVRKFEDPVPDEVKVEEIDLVTMMFNYHDLGHMNVDRSKMNQAVFSALRPGGVYVIADHSGRLGTGISEAGTLHRVEESFVRKEVESAGFKFVAEGNFLRNPADPRDKNTPDNAQAKDAFILKFVKP